MATIKEQFELNTENVNLATELLKVLSDRAGRYVWKQLTAEGGDFVAFVTADSEDSYPDGGTQDGAYYVKFDPATAIAENIREGISIFDILGTMSEGIDLLGTTKFSKVSISTFTVSSITSALKKALPHSLGTAPKMWVIVSSDNGLTRGQQIHCACGTGSAGPMVYIEDTYTSGEYVPKAYTGTYKATSSQVTLQDGAYKNGRLYTLMAFA